MLQLPLSGAEFRERYFERAPLLARKAAQAPFTLRDLSRTLDALEPDERSVQLFNGAQIPQHTYASDAIEFGQRRRRLDKPAFYAHLRDGATLVLNRFEAHDALCRELTTLIGRFIDLPTTSNAYLSFGGRGTFGHHWDTHDVFAIQLIGRKRWQVFAPTFPLPLSHHTSDAIREPQLGEPLMDFVLESGDVLYLPRGWWHRAMPLEQPSFHVSVGAYAATAYDYLMWLCTQVLPQHAGARQAFAALREQPRLLASLFDELRKAAADPQAMSHFERELARRERHSSELDLGRHVSGGIAALRGDERVVLTMSAPIIDRDRVLVNGQWLALEPCAQRFMHMLRSGAAFTIDALCMSVGDIRREDALRTLLALAEREVINITAASAEMRVDEGGVAPLRSV